MSRQIKFRAWDGRRMRTVWKATFVGSNPTVFFTATQYNEPGALPMDDDRLSLMQFTGLQDKAGRDIYEGDILRLDTVIEADMLFDTPERHLRALFKVVYKDDYACFDVEEIEDPEEEPVGGWSLMKDCQNDWEIVGNVYENPELITHVSPQS
jgi:uncharacterized phage protein (TIGR01671 family)